MSMYVYYQIATDSSQEAWKPIQANQTETLAAMKPTFITVLQLDTVLTDKPPRDVLEKVKYQGPMYFDLDSKDISESITDTHTLLDKLCELGLTESDMEIYLSGKKGIHILIPQEVFLEKPAAMPRLPAIYKEIAFKLAVRTLDLRVYTARRGRMFRTCYNQRDNGLYKVPVTYAEMREMTPELYTALCSAPRTVPKPSPTFRWQMGMEFQEALSKLPKAGSRRAPTLTPQVLTGHWTTLKPLFDGDAVSADMGFNKIGMQLALYAREMQWSEDLLVEKAQGLIQKHQSDGYRYNTPAKREEELRRMYCYVDDNPAYDYSFGAAKAMMAQKAAAAVMPGDEVDIETVEELDPEAGMHTANVSERGTKYIVEVSEDEVKEISNFVFRNLEPLMDLNGELITSYRMKVIIAGKRPISITVEPRSFTSSSSVQNLVASYGGVFTGNDSHARGISSIMMKDLKKRSYTVESEGVSLVTLTDPTLGDLHQVPFPVWADSDGVILPGWVQKQLPDDVSIAYTGWPEPDGNIQSDLADAPDLAEWIKQGDNREKFKDFIRVMFKISNSATLSKLLGWFTACHWRAFFHECTGKFPLLHVYGAAGSGKTETTTSFLNSFYLHEEPKQVTPTGTPFAFLTYVSSTHSIPVLMDEYKPHKMNKDVLERYRGVFRDAYNSKEHSRGGGSKSRESFQALSRGRLASPIIFIAEAVETETAILERSVLVPVRRATARQAAMELKNFMKYQRMQHIWPIIGKALAGVAIESWTPDSFSKTFDALFERLADKYSAGEDDYDRVQAGTMSQAEFEARRSMRPRPMHNLSVVTFGLDRFKDLLQSVLTAEEMAEFQDTFTVLYRDVFAANEAIIHASMPEYLKVMQVLSDLSRMEPSAVTTLTTGRDYSLAQLNGEDVLVMHPRIVYNKYRAYCRALSMDPLFATDVSFEVALSDSPQFRGFCRGTADLQGKAIVLSLGGLTEMGVAPFIGKLVHLKTW